MSVRPQLWGSYQLQIEEPWALHQVSALACTRRCRKGSFQKTPKTPHFKGVEDATPQEKTEKNKTSAKPRDAPPPQPLGWPDGRLLRVQPPGLRRGPWRGHQRYGAAGQGVAVLVVMCCHICVRIDGLTDGWMGGCRDGGMDGAPACMCMCMHM